jgi:hypothetical protein
MSESVTANERRAAHRRGHSLPMHVRAREDSQVANALSIGDGERKSVLQLVDGQILTVDGETIVCTPGGSTEIEIREILAAPVAVSTTPANVFTVGLSEVGTYAVDATFLVRSGTLAANRVATFYFAHPGQGACGIGWAQGASVSTANGFGYGSDFGTALPAVAYASTQDDVYSSVRCWGEFTVSVEGDLTVVVAISGDTASCLAGSFISLRRLS